MAKEDLVGGLRAALARGETLEKAMMSLYNAGYSKEDIEDAVQDLQAPQFFGQYPQQPPQQPTQKPTPQSNLSPAQEALQQSASSSEKNKPKFFSTSPPLSLLPATQQTPQTQQIQQPGQKVVQKISGYGEKPKSPGKIITIVFVFLLLLLLGILAAVILFRTELTNFFNNLL